MTAPVEFHAGLVEEAVWVAVAGRREAGLFHRDRERAYAVVDAEERERAFSRLHLGWFERLGLAVPVRAALGEREAALAPARSILFGPATTARGEGAELFVTRSGARTVVVNLRPRTLADAAVCLPFLRRELLHIGDMLDPAFAYEPRLPSGQVGPAHERRVQDRYRVLWTISVDGRLVRQGLLDPEVRQRRLGEFRSAFARLGDPSACFDRLFSGARPTHPGLVLMATDPEAGFGLGPPSATRAGRCPLCGFPTAEFEPRPARLPPELLRAIVSEFATWRPEHGLCRQCADLYRLRPAASASGD